MKSGHAQVITFLCRKSKTNRNKQRSACIFRSRKNDAAGKPPPSPIMPHGECPSSSKMDPMLYKYSEQQWTTVYIEFSFKISYWQESASWSSYVKVASYMLFIAHSLYRSACVCVSPSVCVCHWVCVWEGGVERKREREEINTLKNVFVKGK